MNKQIIRKVLIVLGVIYIVSPIDLAPGPIDDILVAVVPMLIDYLRNRNREEAKIENEKPEDSDQ